MRITGLGSGLDMDEIIKNSMKPYRIKIDKKGQDKEILEIKQKLYREVIKDSREFYNKYFDVANKDSLLLSKSWTTTKFTSSNENLVSVIGSSEAKTGNYTIKGNSAKSSTATLASLDTAKDKDGNDINKVVINGKEFTVDAKLTNKEKADFLNKELTKAGINVSVRYTSFAGTADGTSNNKEAFIFESKILGSDSKFTVGGGTFTSSPSTPGKDAIAATITGLKVSSFNIGSSNKIELNIGGEPKVIDIDWDSIKKDDTSIDNTKLQETLNSKLNEYNLTSSIDNNGDIKLTSTVLGKDVQDPNLSINGSNIDIQFGSGKDAEPTTNTIKLVDIKKGSSYAINVNGNTIDLSMATPGKEDEYINTVLKQQNIGVTAKLSADKSEIILTSNTAGESFKLDVNIVPDGISFSKDGQDANIIIEDGKGGVYTHTGTSNTLTLDGVTFKVNGDIPNGEKITVNGKQDVAETKDKLVKFINDYNKLIEKLNTITSDKRNKNFMPLTEEQKKAMSEDEVKLWNEKVEKGQLSRDNDITRIANSMKEAMRTLVDGSGLTLEKIGIKPVSDYQGTKNGTFTIDENALTKALEENSEEVMNLFVKAKPSDNTPSNEKYSQTGIAQRLKDILYNETVTVASAILKKAGIEGSSTVANNEISKSIEKYEQKMRDMEKDFSRREQALYSKYAYLETMMNKYNSQQSYLTQQLGMG